MTRTRRFKNDRHSVTAARHFATAVLARQPEEIVNAVELLVSELASNCVRHTDSDFEVAITATRTEISVAATDWGAGQPIMRSPAPTDLSGRGLVIIDALSAEWGVTHRGGERPAKTVWFSLTVQAVEEPVCS